MSCCRQYIVTIIVALIINLAGIAHPAQAGSRPQISPPLVGIAGWAGPYSHYNVHSAPRADAPIVATVVPGQVVTVTGALFGQPIDGVSLWYGITWGTHSGYILSAGIGQLQTTARWTGIVSNNAVSSVVFVYSLAAPQAGAASDAQFAVGTTMTILGVAQGAALEPGNNFWYQVSTGSYRAAYIYSAYLKFLRFGDGPIPVPMLSAAAVLALDLDSGRVLFSRNATVPRAPASLVKLMTAAVALDTLAPATMVTVPSGAPSVGAEIGGSAMGLVPGERLSLTDLLFGMLLPSGNDAAYSIADAVAGSQAAFATRMNAKAAAIGLVDTHFVQGYGLDVANQYSTAQDLALLTCYDLAHYPLLDRIVATADYTIGATATHPAFFLHNLNRLLGVYPGAFGVKTGTTPQAGQNLIAAVQRDGRRILAVVLGSSDRYGDATAILNYAVAQDLRS